jgi:type VI secretion system secreted protein Hcp
MKRLLAIAIGISTVVLFAAAGPPGKAEEADALAADMFIKIEGIEGESADAAYRGWIEVESMQWGVSVPAAGGGATRVRSQSEFSGLAVTKRVDKSSPYIYQAAASGRAYPEGVLEVRRVGSGSAMPYYRIRMQGVRVSSVSTGGSGSGAELSEQVTLNFSQIEWTYTPMDAAGRSGGEITTAWDLDARRR